MPNVHTKKHMFVLVQGKNGLEKREVKATSSDYKIKDRMERNMEKSIHLNRKLSKPI